MITILLADDHHLVREGIRALFERIPDFKVVAEAADGHAAIEQAARHQPDVILLDIAMPGLNGLEALARLRQCAPHSRVLILSMYANPEYIVHALDAGACGYLLKSSSPQTLRQAVARAARGLLTLGPPLDEEQIRAYRRRLQNVPDRLSILSPREREVLQLIAEGHSTQGIAARLGISPKTVESHRARLMRKLELYDIASLTRFAIQQGLVAPEA